MTDGGAVGLVARSHHGATLQCGGVQGGGIAVRGGDGQGGTVAPWRDPTFWQRTGLLAGGGCMVF